MVVVASFASRAEAEVAASMLRARDIDVRVVADDADGAIGLNLALAGYRLQVPEDQRREALALLE